MILQKKLKILFPVYALFLRRKSFSNTYWIFFDQFIRMSSGFFVLAIITRNIGPNAFGQLNFAIAFVSLFSVLTSLGIDRIIIKEVVDDSENYKQTLATSFYLKLLGSFLLVALTFITSTFFFENDVVSTNLIMIFSFSYIFQASEVIEYWYQSTLDSKYPVTIKLIAYALASVLKILVVKTSNNIYLLAAVYLFEGILSAILLLLLFKIRNGSFLYSFNMQRAKQLLSQGIPLLFASLFVTIYMKIDQVFLQYFSDPNSVGLYAAAVRVSEIPFFIGTTITSAAFPLVLKAKKLNNEVYKHKMKILLGVLLYSAVIIAVIFYSFSYQLINIIFGNEFMEASEILKIHIWSLIFVFIGLAQGVWLIGEGQTKLSFIFTVIGALINVILNIILIPLYNGSGAAFATLASYMFTAFLANFFLQKTREFGFMQLYSISPMAMIKEIKKRGLF